MNRTISKITELFPLWAILICIVAFNLPEYFILLKPYIIILLAIVMFGMGITLNIDDFKQVVKKPRAVLLGTILQFFLMPLIAFTLSLAFHLPKDLMIGLVLVGCCPGGTASNLICYLAKGDVALSISLTTVSTLISFIATPLLTLLYIGEIVSVPVNSMIVSIIQIIIIPVCTGVAINSFFNKQISKYKEAFPLVSVISIVIIIGIVIALNHDNLLKMSFIIVICVILHNILGFIISYYAAKALKFNESQSRTISIEVGMQNSGLGVVLALQFFSATASLPGAIFSIWHNLGGSFLAYFWAIKKPKIDS